MKNSSSTKASTTDRKRNDAPADEDIDLSDSPEVTPAMLAKAVVRRGLVPLVAKEQVTLRLDADVLDWFRSQGKGYQTRINQLLRAYMQEILLGKRGNNQRMKHRRKPAIPGKVAPRTLK